MAEGSRANRLDLMGGSTGSSDKHPQSTPCTAEETAVRGRERIFPEDTPDSGPHRPVAVPMDCPKDGTGGDAFQLTVRPRRKGYFRKLQTNTPQQHRCKNK